MPATYEPIDRTTLNAPTGIVIFNSIPPTYTDLKIVVAGVIGDGFNAAPVVQVNANTSNVYSNIFMASIRTELSVALQNGTNNNVSGIRTTPFSLVPGRPFLFNIDIFNYLSTANKTMLVSSSIESDATLPAYGDGGIIQSVGLARVTAAIERIDLSCQTIGTFGTGTTFSLYGIKAA